VALPFGLTVASLVCILIVMLAGITDKNLDMFEVKTQNLSISSSSLVNLENLVKRAPADHFSAMMTEALNNAAATKGGINTTTADLTTADVAAATADAINITAADLGLADSYRVNLWNFCAVTGSKVNCTSAKFDWAASALNTTAIEKLASSTSGVTVTLPKEMTDSLKTFTVFDKWTEVVYIIAAITCAIEIVVSLFSFCSRAGSCITFLISGLSTTAIIAASVMATVESSIVTGALDSVAKAYGVKSTINTSFLATTWIAAAFSIGSGFFWMFTICCCAADHHSKKSRRNRGEDAEKLIPAGAYQRVVEEHHPFAGQQTGVYNAQQWATPSNNAPAVRGGAYEPYSHSNI